MSSRSISASTAASSLRRWAALRVAAKASIPAWRTATRVSTSSLPLAVIRTWRTRRSSGSSTRVASLFLTRASTARLIEGTETPKTSARSPTCQVSAVCPSPPSSSSALHWVIESPDSSITRSWLPRS